MIRAALPKALVIAALALAGSYVSHAADLGVNDFPTVESVRTFDFSALKPDERESLARSVDTALAGQLRTQIPGYRILDDAGKPDEGWCVLDEKLAEIRHLLAISETTNDPATLREKEALSHAILARVMINAPALPPLDRSKLADTESVKAFLMHIPPRDQYLLFYVEDDYADIAETISGKREVPAGFEQLLQSEQCRGLQQHADILKEIVATIGWPDPHVYGSRIYDPIFLIVQHVYSDSALQLSFLPVLKDLADRGLIAKSHYPYLYDRIRNNRGLPQRFGTQLDGCGLKPLEDPDKVDTYRAEYDLPTVQEYLAFIPYCKKASE